MKSTVKSLLLAAVFVLPSVRAHGHITSWIINGKHNPGYTPYWPAEQGPTAERPTDNLDEGWADYWSPIVACGGMSAPNSVLTWDVQAGSTITAKWDEWDWGHRGPVLEYMAACPSSGCTGVNAWDLDWFKISHAGWDGREFASERITRGLTWDFKIPAEIAPGHYLIRHEIIAMHRPNEPQPYPVCFQANVKSSGNVRPTDTVRFPAAYNQNDDFKRFNLYWGSDFNKFTPPGPAVYDFKRATPAPAPAPAPAPTNSPKPSPPAAKPSPSTGNLDEPVLLAPGPAGHCKRRRKRVVRDFH